MSEMELPRVVPEVPDVSLQEVSVSEAGIQYTSTATQTSMEGECETCGYVWAGNVLVEKGMY